MVLKTVDEENAVLINNGEEVCTSCSMYVHLYNIISNIFGCVQSTVELYIAVNPYMICVIYCVIH